MDEPELHLGADILVPDLAGWKRAKLPVYAREQVRHVWMVDPLERTLEILRLEGPRWTLLAAHRDAARVRAEPFDAIELDLSVLWADLSG